MLTPDQLASPAGMLLVVLAALFWITLAESFAVPRNGCWNGWTVLLGGTLVATYLLHVVPLITQRLTFANLTMLPLNGSFFGCITLLAAGLSLRRIVAERRRCGSVLLGLRLGGVAAVLFALVWILTPGLRVWSRVSQDGAF